MPTPPVVNPFRYSGPVGIDDLIDRDVECEALLARAREGNNSRLVAPRRFGKTSLLRRVIGEARADGWAAVYVDFFGVVTLADVAERIERAYTDGLQGAAARWFDGARRMLRPTVYAGVPGTGVAAQLTLDPASNPLLDRLELPRRLYDRWGTRVLVVFDEFQGVLTAQSDADAVIRSVIQHHGEAASYTFAGSHPGMMTALFADRGRAFYAQARPVELPPLPAEPTARFLTERFAATGRELGSALGPLLELAAGHPQRTMLLAHALWELTPAAGRAEEEQFLAAYQRVLGEVAGEFRVLWSALPTGQRRLLTLVADDRDRPYSRAAAVGGSKGGTVRAALAALRERGEIVEDLARRSGYRVVDPLLAAWVRAGRPESADW